MIPNEDRASNACTAANEGTVLLTDACEAVELGDETGVVEVGSVEVVVVVVLDEGTDPFLIAKTSSEISSTVMLNPSSALTLIRYNDPSASVVVFHK